MSRIALHPFPFNPSTNNIFAISIFSKLRMFPIIFAFLLFSTSLAVHVTYPPSRTIYNYKIIFEADISGSVEFLDKLGQKATLNFDVPLAYTDISKSSDEKLVIGFLPKIAGFDWPKEKEWFLTFNLYDYFDVFNYRLTSCELAANFIEELKPRKDIWEYTNSSYRWQITNKSNGFQCDESKFQLASEDTNPLFATLIFSNLKFVPRANQESAQFKSDQVFDYCKWYLPYWNFIKANWWIFAIGLPILLCFCCCCECFRELAKSIWEGFKNLLEFLFNLLQSAIILLFTCLCCLCCIVWHCRQEQEERAEQERQTRAERIQQIHRLRQQQAAAQEEAAREQISRDLFAVLLLHSIMNEGEGDDGDEEASTSAPRPSTSQSRPRPAPSAPPSAAEAPTTAANLTAFKECIICLENERAIMFEPCMHLVACEECSEKIKGQSGICPFCRRQVQKMSRVFLP